MLCFFLLEGLVISFLVGVGGGGGGCGVVGGYVCSG